MVNDIYQKIFRKNIMKLWTKAVVVPSSEGDTSFHVRLTMKTDSFYYLCIIFICNESRNKVTTLLLALFNTLTIRFLKLWGKSRLLILVLYYFFYYLKITFPTSKKQLSQDWCTCSMTATAICTIVLFFSNIPLAWCVIISHLLRQAWLGKWSQRCWMWRLFIGQQEAIKGNISTLPLLKPRSFWVIITNRLFCFVLFFSHREMGTEFYFLRSEEPH